MLCPNCQREMRLLSKDDNAARSLCPTCGYRTILKPDPAYQPKWKCDNCQALVTAKPEEAVRLYTLMKGGIAQ